MPSEVAAESARQTASDNVGEESVTDAEVAAVKAADVTEASETADAMEASEAADITKAMDTGDVREAVDALKTKTDADLPAADTAEPQDNSQDV